MLAGESIRLRLVREGDLAALARFDEDIANRGEFFPTGVTSLPLLQSRWAENGLWHKDEGMLVIVDELDDILGHIEFYPTVGYLDELELSYILYAQEHRGRGVATEAVRLLTGYLFGGKKVNRIRLLIHPGNTASKRVAAKAGYTCEGVARGTFFNQGRNHDLEVWSILRAELADEG